MLKAVFHDSDFTVLSGIINQYQYQEYHRYTNGLYDKILTADFRKYLLIYH